MPGTVLVSYLNDGAIPDPNFGRQPVMISDSFFQADFWYRNEFTVPAAFAGRKVWLNFDGINWKAEVFLNGEKLGGIEGGFHARPIRRDLEAAWRRKNALAVRIVKNSQRPGSVKEATVQSTDENGGALGADNPTFHASIGWDWIPTIRGRETGHLEQGLPDGHGPGDGGESRCDVRRCRCRIRRAPSVTIEVTLRNHSAAPVVGNAARTLRRPGPSRCR